MSDKQFFRGVLGQRAALATAVALLGLAVVSGGHAQSLCSRPNVQTFVFTGAAASFVVPAGVTQLELHAFGAAGTAGTGGNAPGAGGLGGSASGLLNVTPGATLTIHVGGSNGFNGGGAAGSVVSATNPGGTGGAGGGASDVRTGAGALTDRVLVAGGGGGGSGGGAGTCSGGVGGVGGASAAPGSAGTGCSPGMGGQPGGAATLSSPGAGGVGGSNCSGPSPSGLIGALAVGGVGGDGSTNGCSPDYAGTPGGGGGGGYYGGGGGGGGAGGGGGSGGGGGGGGGVSYIGGVTSATTADGVQAGDGMVALCYDTPSIATVQPVPTLGQSLLALLGLALAGLAMLRVRRQG